MDGGGQKNDSTFTGGAIFVLLVSSSKEEVVGEVEGSRRVFGSTCVRKMAVDGAVFARLRRDRRRLPVILVDSKSGGTQSLTRT